MVLHPNKAVFQVYPNTEWIGAGTKDDDVEEETDDNDDDEKAGIVEETEDEEEQKCVSKALAVEDKEEAEQKYEDHMDG